MLRTGSRTAFSLEQAERELLIARLRLAVQRARAGGAGTLASISLDLPESLDPCSAAVASRRPEEPMFLFEQPDRGARALAGLGQAVELQSRGEQRFARLAGRWRELAGSVVADPAQDPAQGPLALGGFAFAPDGGGSPQWQGFAPASLIVPELLIGRREGDGRREVRLTLTALAQPDDLPEELLAALERRLGELTTRPLPLLDPAPAGRFQVASTMPPEHFEQAVAGAVERIRGGAFEKIVLAREVQVHAPREHDAPAVFGVLREQFPSCAVFCVARGTVCFVGASPELLVRREGQRVSTLALAGSARRSADPAVDDHLGEQLLRDTSYREEHAIVARRIERLLRPHSVWVTAAGEPELVRIANIQHLATPIRAQLAAPIDLLELAGLMHPTPAVGGEPRGKAVRLIPALEGLDRGWYAGPLGWTDTTGDGEMCVALRCALLRGNVARCFAGNGIVRESKPADELAETEIKLQALLPLLA